MPVERVAGMKWLNGPLVWAIAESYQKMYLFPRECPRILLWATEATTESDIEGWLGGDAYNTVAYIESGWLKRLQKAQIIRYEFEAENFTDLCDTGMWWVSKKIIHPITNLALSDLISKLQEHKTELRVVDTLAPLREVWQSTLHVSGIRLRNAQNWGVTA